MPEVEVQDAQGNTHVFPDGTTPDQITSVLMRSAAGAPSVQPPTPAALQPTPQPSGHTLVGPSEYGTAGGESFIPWDQRLSQRVAQNLQPLQDTRGFLSNLLQSVKGYQAGLPPAAANENIGQQLMRGGRVLGKGIGEQAYDYSQDPTKLAGDLMAAKILAPNSTSEAGAAVRGAADRMLPSINRAKAAFQHLDTGLADVTAADPKFAPHVERISQTAQQVADRFNATKLKSTPPIVDKLIARATDPTSPMSWPELRQFKTDLNTLVWDREIPNQFKGPLKNLVKDVDQGLRAGADLRGQGDIFSKANTDFRRSMKLQQGAETVGPYAGAGVGAGAGALAGTAVGHPWPGYWAGKVAGYKTGGPLAGALVRSITEREVPPESFPKATSPSASPMSSISPSRVLSRSSELATAKAAPTADVAGALKNLGYDKKAANLAVSTVARDMPNASFNDLFKESLNRLRGPAQQSTTTQIQPSTGEILNRMSSQPDMRQQYVRPIMTGEPGEPVRPSPAPTPTAVEARPQGELARNRAIEGQVSQHEANMRQRSAEAQAERERLGPLGLESQKSAVTPPPPEGMKAEQYYKRYGAHVRTDESASPTEASKSQKLARKKEGK